MNSEDFLRNNFYHPKGMKINDDALTEIINFLNYLNIDFNNKIDRIDENKLRKAEIITIRSIEVAKNARRNNIILEDFKIMFSTPKEDISIELAPVKRFVDNNSSKKISNEACKHLISEIDDTCIEILKHANEVATQKRHNKITVNDIKENIN